MTTEETVKQYAQDQLAECGWDRDALDDRLARSTLTQIANGNPQEFLDKLKASYRAVRETERIITGRETMRDRYQEFFPKRNEW